MNHLTIWPDVAEACPNCPHNWGQHLVNAQKAITCPDCDCRSLISFPIADEVTR